MENYIRESIIDDIKHLVEYYKVMLDCDMFHFDEEIDGFVTITTLPHRNAEIYATKWENLHGTTLFKMKSALLEKKCHKEIENTRGRKMKVRLRRDIKIRPVR